MHEFAAVRYVCAVLVRRVKVDPEYRWLW